MGFMERGSLEGVQAKFGEMYIPALLANWQLWPLVQLVNFRYMPLKYVYTRASFSSLTLLPGILHQSVRDGLLTILLCHWCTNRYRVPFVSAVGILWNIGLSLLSQSTRPKQTAKLTEQQAIQLSGPATSKA